MSDEAVGALTQAVEQLLEKAAGHRDVAAYHVGRAEAEQVAAERNEYRAAELRAAIHRLQTGTHASQLLQDAVPNTTSVRRCGCGQYTFTAGMNAVTAIGTTHRPGQPCNDLGAA